MEIIVILTYRLVTSQTLCGPGQFSATGYSPCCNCFPGTYSNSQGSTVCPPCATGMYFFNIKMVMNQRVIKKNQNKAHTELLLV